MNGELGLGGGEDLQTQAVISDTQVTRDPIYFFRCEGGQLQKVFPSSQCYTCWTLK